MMRLLLKLNLLFIVLVLLNACGSKSYGPSMEELEQIYGKRAVQEIERNQSVSKDDIFLEAHRLAKEIYSSHPEVLHAAALKNLNELKRFDPNLLKNYRLKKKFSQEELDQVFEDLNSAFETKVKSPVFINWVGGYYPQVAASTIINALEIRVLDVEAFRRRRLLGTLLKWNFYRFSKEGSQGIVIHCVGEIYWVELELSKEGLWLVKAFSWYEANDT